MVQIKRTMTTVDLDETEERKGCEIYLRPKTAAWIIFPESIPTVYVPYYRHVCTYAILVILDVPRDGRHRSALSSGAALRHRSRGVLAADASTSTAGAPRRWCSCMKRSPPGHCDVRQASRHTPASSLISPPHSTTLSIDVRSSHYYVAHWRCDYYQWRTISIQALP